MTGLVLGPCEQIQKPFVGSGGVPGRVVERSLRLSPVVNLHRAGDSWATTFWYHCHRSLFRIREVGTPLYYLNLDGDLTQCHLRLLPFAESS